jgi:hypothetical protein
MIIVDPKKIRALQNLISFVDESKYKQPFFHSVTNIKPQFLKPVMPYCFNQRLVTLKHTRLHRHELRRQQERLVLVWNGWIPS